MTDTSKDAVERLELAMILNGNTTAANMLNALAIERDAANARADQAEAQLAGARDDALVEAADIILADNYDDPDDAADAIIALRDKPAPAV